MPLYNADRFLEQAIQSVLNQTYSNFELICIDDASQDSTRDIVEKYIADSKVKLFCNLKRMGAAESRNRGLKIAHGEYITFWDGDDYFDRELLAEFIKKCSDKDFDIFVFQYANVESNRIGSVVEDCHSKAHIEKFGKVYRLKDCDLIEFFRFSPATWNKIYRMDFIIENSIYFQNLESSNDVYFSEKAIILSKNIINNFTGRAMLHAREHNTASRISSYRNPMCAYKAVLAIGEELQHRKPVADIYHYFYLKAYITLRDAIIKAPDEKTIAEFGNFIKKGGIDRVIECGEEHFDMIKPVVKNKVLSLKECVLSRNWAKERQTYDDLEIFFYERGSSFFGTMKRWHAEGKKIGIWGIGKRGVYVINECLNNKIEFDYLLDSDIEKVGKRYFYKEISSIDNYRNCDVVVFTTRGIFNQEASLLWKKAIDAEFILEVY